MAKDQDHAPISCGGLAIHLGTIPEKAAYMREERQEEIISAISSIVREIVLGPINGDGEAPKSELSSDVDLMQTGLVFDNCIPVANGRLLALLIDKNLHFSFVDGFSDNFDDDDPAPPKPPRTPRRGRSTPSEFVRAVDRTLRHEFFPPGRRVLNLLPTSSDIYITLTFSGWPFLRLFGEMSEYVWLLIGNNSSLSIVDGSHAHASTAERLRDLVEMNQCRAANEILWILDSSEEGRSTYAPRLMDPGLFSKPHTLASEAQQLRKKQSTDDVIVDIVIAACIIQRIEKMYISLGIDEPTSDPYTDHTGGLHTRLLHWPDTIAVVDGCIFEHLSKLEDAAGLKVPSPSSVKQLAASLLYCSCEPQRLAREERNNHDELVSSLDAISDDCGCEDGGESALLDIYLPIWMSREYRPRMF